MPEFSIIVPVYKTENSIARCINSILEQNYFDFELILIDDGSPDLCGDICESYAMADKRIRVFHQVNKGVSSARNVGLRVAMGKYVVFIDSDDTLEPNCLSCMAEIDEKIDLVICDTKKISIQQEISYVRYYRDEKMLPMTQKHILNMIENRAINFVHGKRFCKKIIEKNNIFFDEKMDLGEDTHFVAQYLCKCQQLFFSKNAVYCYYEHSYETLSSFNDMYVRKLIAADKKIVAIFNHYYGDISENIIWKKRIFSVFHYSVFYVLKTHKYSFKKKYKLLKSILQMEEFVEYILMIDLYMDDESWLIRRIISTKFPLLILVCWYLIETRKKIMK